MRTTLLLTSGLALLFAIALPAQARTTALAAADCSDELVAVNCVYYTDECSPSGNGEPCLPYQERHFCTLVVAGSCVCWSTVLSCIP